MSRFKEGDRVVAIVTNHIVREGQIGTVVAFFDDGDDLPYSVLFDGATVDDWVSADWITGVVPVDPWLWYGGSGGHTIAVFASEIDALRHLSAERYGYVKRCEFGAEVSIY